MLLSIWRSVGASLRYLNSSLGLGRVAALTLHPLTLASDLEAPILIPVVSHIVADDPKVIPTLIYSQTCTVSVFMGTSSAFMLFVAFIILLTMAKVSNEVSLFALNP